MSLYLLDTNTVSFIANSRSGAARKRLDSLPAQDTVSISTVTEGELLYGLAKSPNPNRRQLLEEFLDAFTIHSWDRAAADVYGTLRAQLERRGQKLGAYDMQIAAHAVALGAILVSHDKGFRRISGLKVENWATDIP